MKQLNGQWHDRSHDLSCTLPQKAKVEEVSISELSLKEGHSTVTEARQHGKQNPLQDLFEMRGLIFHWSLATDN